MPESYQGASPSSPTEQPDVCRAAFERWVVAMECGSFSVGRDGDKYSSSHTHLMWLAFKEAWKPERESGEPMVPKWSLDSQIEISNALRKELEACQKRLLAKGEFEMMNTPVTNFNLQRLHPDIKPLTEEQRAEL